jgi:flagellin-like protein
MKKGISPLIAVVLLIGFTMAIAGILASWATSYAAARTAELTEKEELQVKCRGGVIEFISGIENPRIQDNKIVAIIEVGNVPLGNFTFEIIYGDGNVTTLSDTTGTSLAPGRVGTIISETLTMPADTIKQVRIGSNCSDVKSVWKTIG